MVQFLIQQTRSNEDFRLVDSRNFAGETPLLRCMSTGNIPVAKVLIEEGSDCLATDNSGGSIFTRLARAGHLWCLNFMFNTIWYVPAHLNPRLLLPPTDPFAFSPPLSIAIYMGRK